MLRYEAGVYDVRMRKRLVNRGSSPVCRFFIHNERAQFPLYPGQSASLEYAYGVADDKWGQWFQRAVRLPTGIVRVELDFPTSLSPMVWGSQTSPMMGRLPLRTAMRRNEEAGRTAFEWATEQPTLQSRYRFEWTFRSTEA